ncbi:MAG: Decarboxylase NovR [Holosporales bacterium]
MISQQEQYLREELSIAYHIAAYFGWDDLIYGHLSCRLPNEPECYLINPFGLLFDEVTPENLLKVDLDGNIVSKNPYNYNPAGENVHGAIYKKRPDVGCVIHLHTTAGMAISTLKTPILPLTQHACHIVHRVAIHEYEGIAVERDERERLCNDLGMKDILVLRNHGILTVGENIPQAFCTMYMIEKSIQAQIVALSFPPPLQMIPTNISEKVFKQAKEFGSNKNYQMEWEALKKMLAIRKKT